MIFRGMYEELKTDLTKKGCGGIVEQIEKTSHNYKNDGNDPHKIQSSHEETSYTTKTKNENPAALFPFDGGASFLFKEAA